MTNPVKTYLQGALAFVTTGVLAVAVGTLVVAIYAIVAPLPH